MAREFPTVPFERDADDAVVRCGSQRRAAYARRAITSRMERVGLRLHPDKTQVVDCKDDTDLTHPRRRARPSRSWAPGSAPAQPAVANGRRFTAFLPAIGKDALKRLSRTVRGWRLHRRADLSLAELARMINPIIAGWMRYYAAFHRSALSSLLARINTYLVRWTRKKDKRLRTQRNARAAWERVTRQHPGYFAHWAWVRTPLTIKMAGAE